MASNFQSYGDILKREGTSIKERYPDALRGDQLYLDDRQLQDFLEYARRYTANVRFYDPQGGAPGNETWQQFFSSDTIYQLASLAVIDMHEIKNNYDKLLGMFREERNAETFNRLLEFVLLHFDNVKTWYDRSPEGGFLRRDLGLYIASHLQNDRIQLLAIANYLNKLNKDAGTDLLPKLVKSLEDVHNIWQSSSDHDDYDESDFFAGTTSEEKLSAASVAVNRAFDAVYYVTRTVTEKCNRYFQEDLFRQHNHEPHSTLFITFIKLLGFVQKDLNKIPARMLDYYYREVLLLQPAKAEPDHAVVHFELSKGFDRFKLDKGVHLSAGKDGMNREILFKTAKPLVINNCKVAAIRALQIRRSRYGIEEYHAKNILQPGIRKTGPFHELPFGSGPAVQVGLAISSSQLHLAKGQRQVTVKIFVKDQPKFASIDASMLRILLTGENGWLDSDLSSDNISIDYLKVKPAGEDRFSSVILHFTVSIAQVSAVVAFDPAIHTGNFKVDQPVIQLLLKYPPRPTSKEEMRRYVPDIAALQSFQSLEMLAAEIIVEVGSMDIKPQFDGVRNLWLENHESPLNAAKPFLPFTASPRVGSSFYIGCPDLYYKSVYQLSINIEWMIPDNFLTYYQSYFPPYDSNRFMASLSILLDNQWEKIKDVSLIDARQQNGKFRSIQVDFDKNSWSPGKKDSDKSITKFDTGKRDKTLKLKLLYPDFGHDIYPQLMTASVMQKAAGGKGMPNFMEIIKRDLRDFAISIKLPPEDEITSMHRAGDWSNAVIFQNLRVSKTNADLALVALTDGLRAQFLKVNKSEYTPGEIGAILEENSIVVNDDGILARIVQLLKKINLLSQHVYIDHDKQDLGDVAAGLKDKLNRRSSHLMPSDRELCLLIISQVNSVINQICLKAATRLIDETRQNDIPSGQKTFEMLKQEVEDANIVINDMIAEKIAVLLLANEIPPKPYTPLINTLAISYASRKVLSKTNDRFYHVLPFGVSEIHPFGRPTTLFPGNIIGPPSEGNSGMLFLGLDQVATGDNISLYFIFSEREQHPDLKPPELEWWYISNLGWVRIPQDLILTDGTLGFQQSGIVEIGMPEDADIQNSNFAEPGLCWIAAMVSGEVNLFPYLEEIYTQAIPVSFEDDGNDPKRLLLPLSPRKITRFVDDIPAIKKVSQPLASFNGKMAEQQNAYYTRISERLRHKQRAITAWDYERLVLENFPSIFKVNCISNYDGAQFLPGHVCLVPMINLANTAAEGMSQQLPVMGYPMLKSIYDFITAHASPFIKLHVINPDINFIRVTAQLKFTKGLDRGYHLRLLDTELKKYLSPWAVVSGKASSYSSTVYLSSIIQFIEQLPYVDYVTNLVMEQYRKNEMGENIFQNVQGNSKALTVTVQPTLQSILISAEHHQLEAI
jgi:hypothetical protein